jgi:formylglycine-generating enzyme required for sulfatase activity
VAFAIGACNGGSSAPESRGTGAASDDAGSGDDADSGAAFGLGCLGGDCPDNAPVCCFDVAQLSTSCQLAPCSGFQLCATASECEAGYGCTLAPPMPGMDAAIGLCAIGVPDSGDSDAPDGCGPANGLTSCGPGCQESCAASLEVEGGTYDRTYASGDDGGASDPATVSGFRLDEYDVTVGRFRQFVSAVSPSDGGGWLPPTGSGKHTHLNGGLGLLSVGAASTDGGPAYEPGWVAADSVQIAPTDANLTTGCGNAAYATWTASPGANEDLPINCVNWYEAYAFCIWDGGFLPSEAEWECAAAGGSQQREYPWGSTAPGTASQYAIYGCDYPSGSGTCSGVSNIAPVGAAGSGDGRSGQFDLAGSVSQWTLDFSAPYVDPCVDCAYLSPASARVFRGGNFSSGANALAPSNRAGGPAALRLVYFGLRCARSP